MGKSPTPFVAPGSTSDPLLDPILQNQGSPNNPSSATLGNWSDGTGSVIFDYYFSQPSDARKIATESHHEEPDISEYPAACQAKWMTMRFGRSVFFGSVTGIFVDDETDRVLGYVEQSHRNWPGPGPKLVVSSTQGDDVPIDTAKRAMNIPNATETEYEEYRKNYAPCRKVQPVIQSEVDQIISAFEGMKGA